MIRYQHEYNTSGTGLGCQISAYVLMMSLATDTDYNWSITSKDFNLFRKKYYQQRTYFELDDDDSPEYVD